MIGILYIVHGSQKKEKNQAAITFIQALQHKLDPNWLQSCAFLENHPETIEIVAGRMIARGVKQLIAVPILLFEAKHACIDIPAALKKVQSASPEVEMIQTETFGSKKNCRIILEERFKEQVKNEPKEKFIGFLIAHGTKRSEKPQAILKAMASEIQANVQFPIVATSLKGKEDYVEIIRKEVDRTKKKVIIVPFFLFKGHLIDGMRQQLYPYFQEELILTKTLAFDPRILIDIEEIVQGAVRCIQSC